MKEFTYIDYTDGEIETRRELKCPAVVLQDKRKKEVRFIAYAYPLEGGDWIYRDNYFQKVLIYCIKQEQIEINNEDECNERNSSCHPELVMENTDEMALKLQEVVTLFTELCRYDDNNTLHNKCGEFGVEGSLFIYQIEPGNISDRWLDQTGPFCYDTPIEKYKAFLEGLERDDKK